MFGVKRLSEYILGHRISFVSNHRPLSHIFSPAATVPSVAVARLQRCALLLSMHAYEMELISGARSVTAEALGLYKGRYISCRDCLPLEMTGDSRSLVGWRPSGYSRARSVGYTHKPVDWAGFRCVRSEICLKILNIGRFSFSAA